MKNKLSLLVVYALFLQATDIHIVLHRKKQTLAIAIRRQGELTSLVQDIFPAALADYIRYASGMDLCQVHEPQSGMIVLNISGQSVWLRASALESGDLDTCTLRILQNSTLFSIHQLTKSKSVKAALKEFTRLNQGLIIACGPTGSGKTTTIHALLQKILQDGGRKIVTLEDPIEIRQSGLVQLAVQSNGLISYERGIEELMRHDPDVIFLGECRSALCATMAVRAALTGHLVFTTLHAGNGEECIHRLMDLGVSLSDLQVVCKGIMSIRLRWPQPEERLMKECSQAQADFEIWNHQSLKNLLCKQPAVPSIPYALPPVLNHEDPELHQAGSDCGLQHSTSFAFCTPKEFKEEI